MPYVSEDRSGALQRNIDAFVSMCFSGKAPTSPEGKVLYPTMPFAAADELRASFPGNQIDWDVIYGTKILLVENCVAYETSGETRHSSFCYYYWNGVSPDSQVNDCGKGSARAN
jgi:hypothetical protein